MASQRLSTKSIVGLSVGGVVLVLLITGLVVMSNRSGDLPVERAARRSSKSTAAVAASGSVESTGFATPKDAAAAAVPKGHILQLAEESQDLQLFWSSPPQGEWDRLVTVQRSAGLWRATKVEPWSIDEAENGSASAEDGPSNAQAAEAQGVVESFLTAIWKDTPREAQKLTIAPLHDDPASTQESNGEFTSFAINDVQPHGKDNFWVFTTETWTYGVESWRYDVVLTRSGMRIRNIEPAE